MSSMTDDPTPTRHAPRRGRRLLSAVATAITATLAVTMLVTPAQAVYAESGSGRYLDSIFWFEWKDPISNAGTTQTNSITVEGTELEVTCSIANLTRSRGSGAGNFLSTYRPGGYVGDMLDDLYNRGGRGTANTMAIGLRTQDRATVSFDFACSSTLDGVAAPLAGLVMADSESTAPSEFIAATIAPSGTWRIIDRANSAGCAANSIVATRTQSATANTLRLGSTGECATGSPVNVAYMDGVSRATNVTVHGGGREAIALGVMTSFEGSDAPSSYGSASHKVNTAFSGGEIPLNTTVRTNDAAFALAQPVMPTPRLGSLLDADMAARTSDRADGDDLDVTPALGNANDEDAVRFAEPIVVVPQQTYSLPVSCTGPGFASGWMDWNRDGSFAASERSAATCTNGIATFSWVVPMDARSTPAGADSFLRLRIGNTAATVQRPTGLSYGGEVEDHALRIVVPQPAANPDAATTPFETPVVVPVLGNDVTGGSPFDASTLRLVAGGLEVTTLPVDGGVFTVTDGAITFTPDRLFAGTTPDVAYAITDELGRRTTSTVTVAVTAPPAPGAVDDATTGLQGQTQSVDPLANDVPALPSLDLRASTLRLLDDSGAEVTTLTVPGQGSYSLTLGQIVFRPEAGFTGTATGVRYSVSDEFGSVTTARYTPTVTRVAQDDHGVDRQGATQTIDVLANDTSPGMTLVRTTLRLIDPESGNPTVLPVIVPGEGRWQVVAGQIVFIPEAGFVGNTATLLYRVNTLDGDTIEAHVSATVTPVIPAAAADMTTGVQGRAQTIDPLANDSAGHPDVPLDRATLTFIDADGDARPSITVPNVGTYSLSGGQFVFTPEPEFSGVAPVVTYQVADINGATTRSTYGAVVQAVAPTAFNDSTEGDQGETQEVRPLDNDRAGDPLVPLDPDSLTLLDANGDAQTSLETVGVGRWEVVGDRLVFTPESDYVGVPQPVTYRVSDSNGTITTAMWSVEVFPGVTPDTSDDLQGQTQVVDVLSNDPADVDGTTLKLVDPATDDLVDTLDIAGEGRYRVVFSDQLGRLVVEFEPLPAFRGAATPVRYDVESDTGAHRQTNIVITVAPVTPTATPDTTTGPQGVPQSVDPLTNDAAGDAVAPLAADTLVLVDANGDVQQSVTIAGGSYAIVDGRIVFTPERDFIGTAPAVTYRVADVNGTTAVATYTPSLTAVSPLASDDVVTGPQGSPVSGDPLANDAAGDAGVPLDATSLTLVGADAAGTVVVADQGTYSIDRTDPAAPRIVFTPLPTWTGEAAGVVYRVADANGTATTATFRAVLTPVTPQAQPDAASARQGAPASVAPLANDTAGADGVPLVASSLTLLGSDGSPATSVTVDGQGTYTIDTTDPTSPRIVFTPLPTWTGAANPVSYRVADANGTATSSTFTPTLDAVTPVATDDVANGRQGVAVATTPLANDAPGDAGVTLDPASLTLLDRDGARVDVLTIDGEGSYAIDRSDPDAPRLVFTPVASFSGTATPARYRVSDVNGTPTEATFTPTLAAVTPAAQPDVASARQGAPVTVAPLGNDVAGHPDVPLAAGTLTLLGADGAPAVSVEIPGQGVYTVDAVSDGGPFIVFTPELSFTGTATPVTYRVGDANLTTARSTFTPTITPVTPAAQPDTATAGQGSAATVNPLLNDAPGDPEVPLAGRTVVLIGADGAATDEVVVANEGTYTVSRTVVTAPRLVFTPLPTFSGTATPVTYSVADANGTPTQSTFTPTIGAITPTSTPDEGTARQGASVTVSPTVNDAGGSPDVPLERSSFTLLDADGQPVESFTVAGVGTWTTDRSMPNTPQVTFAPVATFTGEAVANYRVVDANGTRAAADTSTITAIIVPVVPDAEADFGAARQGAAVSSVVLANDLPGHPDVPLVASTLTLLDAGGTEVSRVSVNDEAGDEAGAYTIDRSDAAAPRIVFTPQPDFRGTAPAVNYRVSDANGTPAWSTFTPTIAGVDPVASPDRTSTRQGAVGSVQPLSNDVSGSEDVALESASLRLIDDTGAEVDPTPGAVLTTEHGTWFIDRSANANEPTVSFTPNPSFVGDAVIEYIVRDANGTPTRSTITVVVIAVTPTATADSATAQQGSPAASAVLGNDLPGHPESPLDPASLELLDATGTAVETVPVPGQGVYTIDRSAPDEPRIVFTPEPSFVGPATPVRYGIADVNGTVAEATFAPTITAVTPVAADDETTVRQGATATLTPLTNDAPGSLFVLLAPTTLTLLDADGNAVDELPIAGQGVWRVDRTAPAAPTVVFVPERAFTGTAAARYRVSDTNGTPTEATLTVIVTPATPVAVADASSGSERQVQSVDPLANDAAGHPAAPLDPATLTLLDADGQPVTRVHVAGQGRYELVDDRIVFTPENAFVGTATPVRYAVADANGTVTESTYTPTVTPGETVIVDRIRVEAERGSTVTIDPSAEVAGIDRSTLHLVGVDGAQVTELEVPGEGTWRVDTDRGVIVFEPERGFDGNPTPVRWTAVTQDGEHVVGEIEIVYVDDEPTPSPTPTEPTPGPTPTEPTPGPTPTEPVPTPTDSASPSPTEPVPGPSDEPTNAVPGDPEPTSQPGDDLPSTGVSVPVWLIIGGAAAVGVGVLLAIWKKRKDAAGHGE